MKYILILLLLFSCKGKSKVDYSGKSDAVSKRYESQKDKIKFETEIRIRLLDLGIKGEAADKYIDSMNNDHAKEYGNNTIRPYLNPYISNDSAMKLIDSIFGK